MRFTVAVIPALYTALAAAALLKRDCTHNNCLRALIGEQNKNGDAVNDACSAVLVATVKTDVAGVPVTTVAPTGTMPTYASNACVSTKGVDRPARYASACSCIGAPAATVTVPAEPATGPSITVTHHSLTDCTYWDIIDGPTVIHNGACVVSTVGYGSVQFGQLEGATCYDCRALRFTSTDCSGDSFGNAPLNDCAGVNSPQSFLFQCTPVEGCTPGDQ
ncbi:hypothetical protein Dda_8889 [Drechslerella dactyloides]|uniref:Uncharacterized protein n=1 Tax=Drechslerella dactyloides TaxID=74499 RepID=A0AAD6NFN6_DREDA|nr:hypothetical protein Dda_8889 [Drechslerella dactyloides]